MEKNKAGGKIAVLTWRHSKERAVREAVLSLALFRY